MDLTLNTEQRALRAGVSEYLAGRWTADRLRAAAGESGAGDTGLVAEAEALAGWKELAELGVFGLLAPEAAGVPPIGQVLAHSGAQRQLLVVQREVHRGSFGSPSARSARMFFWICEVPAAIV